MQESVNQDRDKYIGGSDIPIIMNLSPFKSRYELLLEKAGYKEDLFEGNIYTDYGNKLEPKIREYINKTRNTDFAEGKHVREAREGETIGVRIHTDGENCDGILEVKTTTTIHADITGYKLYLVQLLFYMVNTGKPHGLLAVYNRPEDLSEVFDKDRLQLFDIWLDDYEETVIEISEACERFITDLEKVKKNPFITEEDLLPSDIGEITRRILAFEDQIKYFKSIESQIKSEKERLKKAMESAGAKKFKTPNGYTITLVDDSPDSVKDAFNEDKFKDENPELYNKYLEPKIIKGKAGYVRFTAPKSKEEG